MATPEDVNAQHLAAMGLAEQPLGQPYATTEAGPSKNNEGRCPETFEDSGFRCARSEGHEGVHARGSLTWTATHVMNVNPDGIERYEPPHPQPLIHVLKDHEPNSDQAAHCPRQMAHESHRWGEEDWYCNGNGTNPEPTKQRQGDQPLPKPGQVCVQDLVIEEMQESKRVGMERYGSTLQTFNGRRSFLDLAEEARDLHVYARQIRAEAEADRDSLVLVVRLALVQEQEAAEPSFQRAAEVAVDAIMGWVVGQDQRRRFRDGDDIFATLMAGGWGRETTYDRLLEGEKALLESMSHAVMDRLGIEGSNG